MNKARGIIGLLLTIALQYSAAASMADGFGCRHSGTHREHGAAMSGMSQQHDHAAMLDTAHAKHTGAVQQCDCPLKCDCASHCAGGSCGAEATIRDVGFASDGRALLRPALYRERVCDPQTNPPFRPPIVAALGAV